MEAITIQHTTLSQKTVWDKVNRLFIAKAIAEFMHELLIQPKIQQEQNGKIHFELSTSQPKIKYQFVAEKRALDYWHIEADTIHKLENYQPQPLDALAFLTEMQVSIGSDDITMAHYLEESSNTLYADMQMLLKGRKTAEELSLADYQTVEHQMTGHPWLVINKGRLGFSIKDYQKYAPENGQQIKLLWLAIHQSKASYESLTDCPFQFLMLQELGEDLFKSFENKLIESGCHPEEYLFIPVHPWQWANKLQFLYAGDIAHKQIVLLGESEDIYLPQQSIRTFFNQTNPDKHYVKTSLSILNTGLIRGLHPVMLKMAPVVTKMVKDMLSEDNFLQSCGMDLLGEIATISYKHSHFSQIKGAPYQYNGMLGCIWRESACQYLHQGETPMTMAALMYVDNNNKSLLGALIEKSGLSVQEWLKTYINAYFKPLLHCFYHHQMFFVPHGENTIMVMKDFVPQRIIMKDFVEEVQFTKAAWQKLPEEIQQILLQIPDEEVPLFIFTDIFDGVFRYISHIVVTHLGCDEDIFWQLVAQVIRDYQQQFPELAEIYQKYDLFAPEFARFCLNRLRLLKYGYKEMADFPAVPDLQGFIANPVTKFK